MKIHVIGSGGREHAIGWAFWGKNHEVYYYPGNAGTKKHGRNLPYEGLKTIKKICSEDSIIIPGSEIYIVEGISNICDRSLAPTKEAARLESSKVFAKLFMKKYGIRTPRFEIVENPEQLDNTLRKFSPPYVLKIDGLAGGKGVILVDNFQEALKKGKLLMRGEFIKGVKGMLVVDEYMDGYELTAIALVNNRRFTILPFVRDYKKIGDNDTGPNTGGMGAWGPVKVSDTLRNRIEELFDKTLYGLEKEGLDYRGFLYLGLMIVDEEPYILEYNVRLGDPEGEVIISMNPENFVSLVLSTFKGRMEEFKPLHYVVDVVLASEGYPKKPRTGQRIIIPEESNSKESILFYGAVKEINGELIVTGGRVLHCIGIGKALESARKNAYELAKKVEYDGKYFRKDIALQ